MHILMIDYEYPPIGGGGGVFNKQLAEALATRNYNITVLTSRYGSLPSLEMKNGVKIDRVPITGRNDRNTASIISMLSFFPASLARGYQLLKRNHFDLIHSFFAIPSAPSGLVMAKIFKLPHVVSILGGDIYDPSKRLSPHNTPLLKQIVKWVLSESDRVVSLSDDIQGRAEKHYAIAFRNIRKIFTGIPRPNFPTASRHQYSLEENTKVVISIGRLVARKAMHDLIEAIHKMNDPMVRLIIIGDGPERARLESWAAHLQLSGQVLFAGNVSDEDKFSLLSISDVYASTSTHEGFGIVFLEAMAAGLPIVCYNCGGQADYLKSGENGFVVQLGNQEGIIQGIRKLLSDDRLHADIRRYNRSYVKNFYILECCQQYEQIYREVVSGNRTLFRSHHENR